MDAEQQMLVRDMKHNSPGWKIVEVWAEKQVQEMTKMLIDENDETLRGKIKGVRMLLNKINRLSKK